MTKNLNQSLFILFIKYITIHFPLIKINKINKNESDRLQTLD